MSTRTVEEFFHWLAPAKIYVGNDRYRLFDGSFVCATMYEESSALKEMIDSLDAGDEEAARAASAIRAKKCWFASHNNPMIAMTDLYVELRVYYFHELNGGTR